MRGKHEEICGIFMDKYVGNMKKYLKNMKKYVENPKKYEGIMKMRKIRISSFFLLISPYFLGLEKISRFPSI